jgi:hypothetical protein
MAEEANLERRERRPRICFPQYMEIARAAAQLLKAALSARIDLLFTMSDTTHAG